MPLCFPDILDMIYLLFCDFPRFSRDIRNVIEQAEAVGIQQMILTGNTLGMSQSAVLQAKAHPGVLYAAVGVHPHFTTKEWNDKSAAEIGQLAKDPVVVAIGEVGLDFHRNYSDEKAQISAFTQQVREYLMSKVTEPFKFLLVQLDLSILAETQSPSKTVQLQNEICGTLHTFHHDCVTNCVLKVALS